MKGMVGVGILILALCGCQVLRPLGLTIQISESETPDTGRWLAGDFHNHTILLSAGRKGPDDLAGQAHCPGLCMKCTGARSCQCRYRWSVGRWGGLAIAHHENLFDDKDSGTTADNYLGTGGKLLENNHAKAVAGVRWLDQHYPQHSYFLINHPSRWQNYSIGAIRDFHDAAPNVAFGFEGMPGHQKAAQRGHYDGGPFQNNTGQDVTFRARTYGGADYMLAKIGGAWDALLGEGRRFFVFVNSDFHTTDHDFWPGEYAKDHTYVQDLNHDGSYSADELIAGLRSGNSFDVPASRDIAPDE